MNYVTTIEEAKANPDAIVWAKGNDWTSDALDEIEGKRKFICTSVWQQTILKGLNKVDSISAVVFPEVRKMDYAFDVVGPGERTKFVTRVTPEFPAESSIIASAAKMLGADRVSLKVFGHRYGMDDRVIENVEYVEDYTEDEFAAALTESHSYVRYSAVGTTVTEDLLMAPAAGSILCVPDHSGFSEVCNLTVIPPYYVTLPEHSKCIQVATMMIVSSMEAIANACADPTTINATYADSRTVNWRHDAGATSHLLENLAIAFNAVDRMP